MYYTIQFVVYLSEKIVSAAHTHIIKKVATRTTNSGLLFADNAAFLGIISPLILFTLTLEIRCNALESKGKEIGP